MDESYFCMIEKINWTFLLNLFVHFKTILNGNKSESVVYFDKFIGISMSQPVIHTISLNFYMMTFKDATKKASSLRHTSVFRPCFCPAQKLKKFKKHPFKQSLNKI